LDSKSREVEIDIFFPTTFSFIFLWKL
jgi:hypothetical protein